MFLYLEFRGQAEDIRDMIFKNKTVRHILDPRKLEVIFGY